MRTIIALALCGALFSAPAALGGERKVIIITIGGNTSTDIHGVVKEGAHADGHRMNLGKTWLKTKGNEVASKKDAQAVMDKIDKLVGQNGGDKSKLALLVVGKSAGGVLAWNTFRLHYDEIDDFYRAALVMVDPHGSVKKDDEIGPYCKRQDLSWPSGWPSDKSKLKVFNIYQWEKKLTGASFPDSKVHKNIRITHDGITHSTITTDGQTKKLIKAALTYIFRRK